MNLFDLGCGVFKPLRWIFLNVFGCLSMIWKVMERFDNFKHFAELQRIFGIGMKVTL